MLGECDACIKHIADLGLSRLIQVAERLQAYRQQQQQAQAAQPTAGPYGTPQAQPMQQPPQGSPSGQIATMSVDQLRSLQVRRRAVRSMIS